MISMLTREGTMLRHLARGAWLLAAALAGCASGGITIDQELKYEGFRTYPTPRTFDGPANVFRVDKDGNKFPVTILKVPVETVGSEEFANYQQQVKWKLGLLAKFLGAVRSISKLEASGNAERDVTVRVKLGPGTRYRTYDADIQRAVEGQPFSFHKDNEYYVVREAIAVSTIDLSVIGTSDLSADAKVQLHEIIEMGANANRTNDERTELVQQFDKPHYVFYTVDKIVPAGLGSLGTGRPMLERVKGVTWVQETH